GNFPCRAAIASPSNFLSGHRAINRSASLGGSSFQYQISVQMFGFPGIVPVQFKPRLDVASGLSGSRRRFPLLLLWLKFICAWPVRLFALTRTKTRTALLHN